MDIIALKLVNGEEILGENISTEVGRFKLKNPVGISIVRGADGKPSVGFSPFPLHADQKEGSTIDIDGHHVVYSYEPGQDYTNNYSGIYGSGIVLPNKTLITG